LDLNLDDKKSEQIKTIKLQQLFDDFFIAETVYDDKYEKCEKCIQEVPKIIECRLSSLPESVLLNLNTIRLAKNVVNLEIPEFLIISENRYTVSCVVYYKLGEIHDGSTLFPSGHYYALKKHNNGDWIKYDDQHDTVNLKDKSPWSTAFNELVRPCLILYCKLSVSSNKGMTLGYICGCINKVYFYL
jgi:hypothetical protein